MGRLECVPEVTLGIVLMGVFENEADVVADKISIDEVAEVIGGALVEVSEGVLEPGLAGKIGGVFAVISRGNFIIFSISSFCMLFEN